MSVLALGDSLTNGFHSDDKSHTPYAKTLESLLNKDKHKCYILETVAKDGAEAHEMSVWLQKHLKNSELIFLFYKRHNEICVMLCRRLKVSPCC